MVSGLFLCSNLESKLGNQDFDVNTTHLPNLWRRTTMTESTTTGPTTTEPTTTETRTRIEKYNPFEVEPRWRNHWRETNLYTTDLDDSSKPKYYAFTMFPYPSGNLHIGHWYSAAIPDTRARFMRMNGYNVFFPMGFDAFGLPAENAAIKNKTDPAKWTYSNIEHMTKQFELMGTMIDWSSMLRTCDAEYYKWNQWFFVQFYKNGLAYKKESYVNWDPVDQTVLANEQVIDGRADRSGALVERRLLSQWHLQITKYAEELLNFDGIDWPERVRVMQTNWIGKSRGAEIDFVTPAGSITVFTTRPDTVYGATFMVLAPEHSLVSSLTTPEHTDAIAAYKEVASKTSEIDRTAEGKEKTGVFTGAYAKNPVTGENIPIWISDYVMITYGSGAIMGVPSGDQRDFEFARKFNLEIRVVVQPEGETLDPATMTEAFSGDGVMVNSGKFDGMKSGKYLIDPIIDELDKMGVAKAKTTFRLRDWLISRQRYWGTPIPIIYCPNCGEQPVPEDQLPVLLPENIEFAPSGQSPLKVLEDWRKCTCPKCGGAAERDTDTMDTFVDSSWYFFRYLDPRNDSQAINPSRVKNWLPADIYSGGIEHAILHLLYARFWTKAMRDLGMIDFGEPFSQLRNQGIILGEDGEKMSKSRGNVVDPDNLVADYGADVVRMYLQFIGPWDQGGPWAPNGVNGLSNWMGRVWTIFLDEPYESNETFSIADLEFAIHSALKKVTEDTENFKFNTSIAAMMELTNTLAKARRSSVYGTPEWHETLRVLNLMLAPYAPHMAEELWARTGHTSSVHLETWPKFDASKIVRNTFELVVQVSGKVRGKIEAPVGASQADVIALARGIANVASYVDGKEIVKEIYVPGKLVNIVVKG
jgi:leucyl-tRNA synthetase